MSILVPNAVTVFDGAISTELFRLGCPVDGCPELFAFDHPEIIRQIHANYIDAGADIICTATFGANRARLVGFSPTAETRVINERLASVAVESAGQSVPVVGVVGPAPSGENQDPYEDQIRGLVTGGVEFILFETMTSVAQAIQGLDSARRITSMPIGVSFTFNQSLRTSDGLSIGQAAKRMETEGVSLVGANCMTRAEDLVTAIRRIKDAVALPILARPNAGIPASVAGKLEYPMTASEFIALAEQLRNAGAGAVGGCCGTTPEFIRLLKMSRDGEK